MDPSCIAKTLYPALALRFATARPRSRPRLRLFTCQLGTMTLVAALKCGYQPMGSQDQWGNWVWGNQQCWGGSLLSNPWNMCWGSSDGGLWDKVPALAIPDSHRVQSAF